MTAIFSLFAIIFGIALLIGFHELGHFSCARLFGIKVQRFSIGFGKVLFRLYDKKGTEYAIGAIPFGGYVKLLDEREAPVDEAEKHLAYNRRPSWQRFLVIIAGPFFNFILATILFSIIFVVGINTIKPIVHEVLPASIAEEAGLSSYDKIIEVNHQPVKNWQRIAMTLVLAYHSNNEIPIVVQREGEAIPLVLYTETWEMDGVKPNVFESLGVVPYAPETYLEASLADANQLIQYPLPKAVYAGFENTVLFSTFNVLILKKIITGEIAFKSLGGPISIVSSLDTAVKQNILAYLAVLAIISIGLGVINLLPVPGLDGAQLLYLCYETFTGKPISTAVQVLLFKFGVIILGLIMMNVIINDLARLTV